jgi:AGZA family xanthine/uracil permease-like MFS transporter
MIAALRLVFHAAGFINERDNSFPRQLVAFCIDGTAIVIGSLLGCAPLTVVIESASGIREGGRTGDLQNVTFVAWH